MLLVRIKVDGLEKEVESIDPFSDFSEPNQHAPQSQSQSQSHHVKTHKRNDKIEKVVGAAALQPEHLGIAESVPGSSTSMSPNTVTQAAFGVTNKPPTKRTRRF